VKTLIFILLISSAVNAQYLTTERFSQIGFSVLAGVSGANADTYVKKRGIKNNVLFHKWQATERVSYVGIGLSIGLQENVRPEQLFADLALDASIFVVAQTITLNMLRDKPLFWQSEYQKKYKTGGFIENINYKWYPVICACMFVINYLIYEWLKP